MRFKRVIKGVGRGSVFGHGRIFGVHTPFDKPENKCRDPYINIRTLARLLKSDPELKSLVSANLIMRWRAGFDVDEFHNFIRHAWKEHLGTDWPVARTEYRKEEDSDNRMIAEMLAEVASDDKIPATAIAHIISFLTPKRGREIILHQKGHFESTFDQEGYDRAYDEWYSSGVDPAHTSFPGVPEEHRTKVFVVDEQDRFAWSYLEPEIDRACELVLLHPKEKQTKILVEMRSFNLELAGKIMDKMMDSNGPYR